MVGKAESEAQQKGLSGLEGLLAVLGLKVTTEGVMTGTSSENGSEKSSRF